MSGLTILIDQNQSAFTPSTSIQGTIRWQLDAIPEEFRLQLFWFTSGKGTTDVQLVESLDFSPSQPAGTDSFQFILPNAPYSFSGKFISLHWALELISNPGSLSQKVEFTLAPAGREIVLPHLEDEPSKISFNKFRSR